LFIFIKHYAELHNLLRKFSLEKANSKEARQRKSVEYELKLVLEKLEALEELHKKCGLEKSSLRSEILERSGGNGDEGYKTMEFIVGKEKEELQYQLQQVKNDVL
jgi:hypothetical protein